MSSTLDTAQLNRQGESVLDRAPSRPIRKILLLDGYSTRTLACVRSWGKMGVEFVVGGETGSDMSLFSRYCKEKCVYTSPKRDIAKFVAEINGHSRRFDASHVFPTSEAAIMACSDRERELTATPIIPTRSEIEAVFSKKKTLGIAEALGIPVPRTLYLTDSDTAALNNITLKFPVVVKSESSEVMDTGRTATSGKTFYARNQAELEKECQTRLALGQSVLLQEFIDGYGVGVSGLFAEGRPVALIGHRRIRESNPMGGPSALAETIAIEPRLLQSTTALLGEVGFTGPAMVEFKVDRHSGEAYLMEINGRFWGSVLLALAAGLELPYLYWKMLNGVEIREDEKQYKIGIRGRSLVGDTKCLMVCLKGKPAGWPGEMPSRGAALKSYLASFFDRQTKELILTADDPRPFIGRLIQANS
jgi:predicted ATP-grasp superfamily ATP-dependent carboligase